MGSRSGIIVTLRGCSRRWCHETTTGGEARWPITALIDQLTARNGWADRVLGLCAELMATSSSGEEKAFEHPGTHRYESSRRMA